MACAACGRIGFDPSSATPDTSAGPCSAPLVFTSPQPLVALDSAANDWAPALSPDGQILVFSSDRSAIYELYMSQHQGGTWSAPSLVSAVMATGCEEWDPTWNAAGTRLYFARRCGGGGGPYQLYVTDYTGAFAAPQPVPGMQTIDAGGPAVSTDELELLYTLHSSTPAEVIARATRASTADAWTDGGALPEFSGMESGWPSLTPDGLTMFFEYQPSATPLEIYSATRAAIGSPFGNFARVAALDIGISEGDPELARDCSVLYFAMSSSTTAISDLFFATAAR